MFSTVIQALKCIKKYSEILFILDTDSNEGIFSSIINRSKNDILRVHQSSDHTDTLLK